MFAYAILRAQPIKVAGVILLISRLIIPALFCFVSEYSTPLSSFLRYLTWGFISNVLVLSWLGQCSVEEPYIFLRIMGTSSYFLLLSLVIVSSMGGGFFYFATPLPPTRPLFRVCPGCLLFSIYPCP